MLATLLLIAVFGTYTRSTNIEDTWFDDIDGPNFLRGVEQEPKQGRNLDFTNHWSRDSTGSSSSSDNYMTSSPSTSSENIVCKVASHPFGINTTRKQGVVYGSKIQVHCHPFLTVVEVNKLHVKKPIPSHIKLHRCMGFCNSDKINCTVTKQDEIKVRVFDVQNPPKVVTLKMFNHTACQCNCTERASDCDAKIQEYDISNCACKCKSNGSHCYPAQTWNDRTCQCGCRSQETCRLDQVWNDSACQCQCRNHDTCNATSSHIWNDSTCKCDCVKKVKDRCARKGKVLNEKKCECECPKPQPVCDAGTSFRKYNCTCV